ncbi:MAG: hypothetical protein A3K19_25610 [Lentisphaerae bacterium RIFOXYB12_FULL_65_16]|nr:MAG: hypothetical protein A3K18_13240 [Lentisphaerae bacterium RIFOXYA12_64_32]OGV90228.1 MAG: hypothetical protein A3K19_25610 [Lentisphaerae bacterium RIFOXYB12_FULL_65_16]
MKPLLFGHARRTITPTVPVSLAGYFNIRMWTGVKDDLYVQALALKQDKTLTVLVHFDLIGVYGEVLDGVRSGCADLAGLKREHILLTGTHTHTAPEIRPHPGWSNPEYNRAVVAQAVACVHDAVAALQPCEKIVYGQASDDRFAFNRRYWMNTGAVITNPPRCDPGIVRPEGVIDPEIGLLGLAVGGKLQVLLTSISNHTDTISGCEVSCDWPGFLRRKLEAAVPGLLVMPLTGASGNINHFNPHGPAEQSGYDIARRIGEGYAESILPVLPKLTESASTDLAVAATAFTTGPREINDNELAEAREHAAKYTFDENYTLTSEDLATRSPAALKYFADRLLKVAADRTHKTFEVRALGIGDAVIVNLPGEPFVEIGLAIRKELCKGRPALIATLNQNAGYIPNRWNFGRGGYETMPLSSPYSVGTADLLLDAVRKALADLSGRKRAPTRKPAARKSTRSS